MKRQVQQATRGKVPPWLRSIAVVMITFGIGWGVFSTITTKSPEATAAESVSVERSGMYRMRDVTAGTEEVVQLAFSENRLEYSYPFVLNSGRRITIVVGGTTTDGVNYILCRKRGDEDEGPTVPPGCYFRGYDPRPCTFSGRSGSCLIPDGRRGTNRVEYTKL